MYLGRHVCERSGQAAARVNHQLWDCGSVESEEGKKGEQRLRERGRRERGEGERERGRGKAGLAFFRAGFFQWRSSGHSLFKRPPPTPSQAPAVLVPPLLVVAVGDGHPGVHGG